MASASAIPARTIRSIALSIRASSRASIEPFSGASDTLSTVANLILPSGASALTPARREREQARAGDFGKRDVVLRDDHARADLGDAPQPLRELARQADAAVRGRTAGHDALMHRDTRPGDALHVGHRRAAVEIRLVEICFWMMLNTPCGVGWPGTPVETGECATACPSA